MAIYIQYIYIYNIYIYICIYNRKNQSDERIKRILKYY